MCRIATAQLLRPSSFGNDRELPELGEYLQMRRPARKQMDSDTCGKCGQSRWRQRLNGGRQCIPCKRKYFRERKERLKRDGVCVTCGTRPAHNGIVRCEPCRERENERQNNRNRATREVAPKVSCARCSKVFIPCKDAASRRFRGKVCQPCATSLVGNARQARGERYGLFSPRPRVP